MDQKGWCGSQDSAVGKELQFPHSRTPQFQFSWQASLQLIYQVVNQVQIEYIGHHTYKNKGTDHKAHDHYHRPNPNSTGKHDKYLDQYGNPVPKGSDESHLYPPEWVWW